MPATPDETRLAEMNDMGPEQLLRWAADHGERAAIFTSFQNTGCVMIDMASRLDLPLRIVTVDTLRLHEETYDLMHRLEKRYGCSIERFKPDPEQLKQMVRQHGEYLFFDNPAKQRYCCRIRKVEPNERALATVDVWITGLRRDQSPSRRHESKAAVVRCDGSPVVKLSPLVDWTEDRVRAYITEHNVPRNPLYDQGYTSIGCRICTTPTRPGEGKRDGRWRWMNQLDRENQKECGIHVDGSGI